MLQNEFWAARFRYWSEFKLGRSKYQAISWNDSSYDRVKITSPSSCDIALRFDPTISYQDKRMIADSVSTDIRWKQIMKNSVYIDFDNLSLESIRDLQSVGIPDSVACTLVVLFDFHNRTDYFHNRADNKGSSVMDIYSKFSQLKKSKSMLMIPENDLLMMYSDLYLNLSPEIADHVFTVAGSSVTKLKNIQKGILSNRWPGECLPDFLKLSEKGLETIARFTVRDPTDSLFAWLSSTIRIISDLSDERLDEADTLSKKDSIERYCTLLSEHNMLYATESPLIAALLLTHYSESTINQADAILKDCYSPSDLSFVKLMSVCEFIQNGGSTDTPVHWMFEMSEFRV